LIDEIIWKRGGMMLSANCVINKPWKHSTTDIGTTTYNASILFVWWTNMCNRESKEWIVIMIILVRNMMIWMVAKCIGQQCSAIRIEGTMREFVVMNTLRKLSPWSKMNTCELWNC
jgi:hypothetical protein